MCTGVVHSGRRCAVLTCTDQSGSVVEVSQAWSDGDLRGIGWIVQGM